MLVLTRRVGEAIAIADEVTVRVIDVRGGRVRLAIDAPIEIAVRREELPPVREEAVACVS